MTKTITAALALAVLATDALAQSRTYYGADGRVSGRSTTDSSGTTTYYGADGRVTGRASTGSDGTVTFYGADGRKSGTAPKDATRSLPTPRR